MNLPAQLRVYKDYIRAAGVVRFEQPEMTVYVAPAKRFLLRQQKAMKLLRHLEVAPLPAPLSRMRGLWVMSARHQHLTDFMSVWPQQTREGKIELIRRLGATVGMVHSLRHSGTGDIVLPNPKPVSQYLVGMIKRNYILCSQQGQAASIPGKLTEMVEAAQDLWEGSGGTLVGNWLGFPPVKIWESGLVIMDLTRARYSVPLLDLVNIHPQVIGLDDIGFFWEYFLQGYGATGEFPENWKPKIELLYRVRLMQALAEGLGEKGAAEDWRSKWWEIL